MIKIMSILFLLGLTGCSFLPDSLDFSYELGQEKSVDPAAVETSFEAVTSIKAPVIDVGALKSDVMEMLGPNVKLESSVSFEDRLGKSNEIYDVIYFSENVDGQSAVRAYLFKDDLLIGIGLSN